MKIKLGILTIAVIGLLVACSKSKDSSSNASTDACQVNSFSKVTNSFNPTGIFTASPVTVAAISDIIQLGNLNAPGHTYPTDHMYIVPTSSAANANNVYAAAAGTVYSVYNPGGGVDYKVIIEVDPSFYYYYDHLNVHNGIAAGVSVSAGQLIGTNSGAAGAVDFGVYNFNNAPLPGILDTCLAESEAYVDSPLKYYSGALQTSLYALVATSGGATQDGKIDYDQAGKLVGDWALAGGSAMSSNANQLAFVYNVSNHGLRISVGGTLGGGAAVYAVQVGATDFATVTTASNQVNYKLYASTNGDTTVSGSQFGVLSVQMLSNTQIKVEIFPGNMGASGVFDGSALIYNR